MSEGGAYDASRPLQAIPEAFTYMPEQRLPLDTPLIEAAALAMDQTVEADILPKSYPLDEAGFTALYADHGHAFRRHARRFIRPHLNGLGLEEDATQEAFVKYYRSFIADKDGQPSIVAQEEVNSVNFMYWASRVCAIDRNRSWLKGGLPIAPIVVSLEGATEVDRYWADSQKPFQYEPDMIDDSGKYAQLAEKLFVTLEPDQRNILWRREVLEEDYETLAADYNTSPGAMRVRVSRARYKVRAAFLAEQKKRGIDPKRVVGDPVDDLAAKLPEHDF